MSVRLGIELSNRRYMLFVFKPFYFSVTHQYPEQAVAQIILGATAIVALQPKTLGDLVVGYAVFVGLGNLKHSAFQMLQSDLRLLDHAVRNNYPATSTEGDTAWHYRIGKKTATVLRSECTDQFRLNP